MAAVDQQERPVRRLGLLGHRRTSTSTVGAPRPRRPGVAGAQLRAAPSWGQDARPRRLTLRPGDPAHPEWGSWGGRFKHADRGRFEDARDTVNGITEARATVWRWRPAFQNEFAALMDWCVKGPKEANHPPVALIDNDTTGKALALEAKAGDQVRV